MPATPIIPTEDIKSITTETDGTKTVVYQDKGSQAIQRVEISDDGNTMVYYDSYNNNLGKTEISTDYIGDDYVRTETTSTAIPITPATPSSEVKYDYEIKQVDISNNDGESVKLSGTGYENVGGRSVSSATQLEGLKTKEYMQGSDYDPNAVYYGSSQDMLDPNMVIGGGIMDGILGDPNSYLFYDEKEIEGGGKEVEAIELGDKNKITTIKQERGLFYQITKKNSTT